MCGSPRPSCEGSWPLWLRRPGAEVSCAAQLLGRACPPRLSLLCLLPAQSAALRAPAPSPPTGLPGAWGGPSEPVGLLLRTLGPWGRAPREFLPPPSCSPRRPWLFLRALALSRRLLDSVVRRHDLVWALGSGRSPGTYDSLKNRLCTFRSPLFRV